MQALHLQQSVGQKQQEWPAMRHSLVNMAIATQAQCEIIWGLGLRSPSRPLCLSLPVCLSVSVCLCLSLSHSLSLFSH